MKHEGYSGAFKKNFKKYNESKTYNEYEQQEVEFDPDFLELDSVTDSLKIMNDLNSLSYKLYVYGTLADSQNHVLQQLEDEFERWKVQTYKAEGVDDKQYKSEKSKERFIWSKYPTEFDIYMQKLSKEKYNLALLQRVLKSLEGYGFKLQALKAYTLSIERNS